MFEKSRYVYAGEFELAGEAYQSDQIDVRADSRFVWIFPLRRKTKGKSVEAVQDDAEFSATVNHLPQGAYAVIGSDLRDEQIDLVNKLLDQLKQDGVPVFDKRDVDRQRYERALGRWYEDVLNQARSIVRELIVKKKRASKARYGSIGVIDDELVINSGSSERDLREALKLLGHDDSVDTEAVFEEARQRVSMPEMPGSLLSEVPVDSIEDTGQPKLRHASINRRKFDGFT